MEISSAFEIGITDYRKIINTVKEVYGYDFNEFALTSFKRRIERFIQLFGLVHPDALIIRLKNDISFFNIFLKEVLVESTEMFRDPSFWRYLRDELLSTLLKESKHPRIWFPFCVSGDELYTFCIVLSETNLKDKFTVIAHYPNEILLESIKNGEFKNYKFEISKENYERFVGKNDFENYFIIDKQSIKRNISYIENVTFIKQNVNFDNSENEISLIICRNRLIYFTQTMHDKVLKIFHNSIQSSGFLALGIKEQPGLISQNLFKPFNINESIYKKI